MRQRFALSCLHNPRLDVFDGPLGQELIHTGPLLPLPFQVGLKRRAHDIVEEEGAINEHGKSEHLQPLESLPAQTKRDNPDEKGAASVYCRTCGGRDSAGDGETKEVEATVEKPLDCRKEGSS